VLYGVARGTGYPVLRAELPGGASALVAAGTVAVLAGPLLKAGAVPAHFWLPDTVQGSSAPVAAFLSTVPKIGALVALFRLGAAALPGAGVSWSALLAVLATASMTLGNLAAFFQDDAKRLLAYSTVSQAGYLLLGVAVAGSSAVAQPALLFYLAGYAVTNIGAFAVVCALPERHGIGDYRGLVARRPALAVALVVCLLGLVGTPPTAVFVGKLEVFTAAFDGGYAWLAIVAAVNTVASLFYYLRWIVPAVSPRGGGPGPVPTPAEAEAETGGTEAGERNCGGTGSGGPEAGGPDGDGTEAAGPEGNEPDGDGPGNAAWSGPPGAEGRPARAVAYAAAAISVALGLTAGPVLATLDGPLAR
jgi:NADH-quinone oxidoreductase subunit N